MTMALKREQAADMPVMIDIAGERLVADTTGALFCETRRALLVADLHLEKGSSYARTRQFVPPYDTIATLNRLTALVARRAPSAIYFLGDAFHDAFAGERLPPEAIAAISALGAGRTLVWIAGNHDPAPPAMLPGERTDEAGLGALVLRHIPSRRAATGEIAGHLHPVARVATRAATVRRPCFISDGSRAILPAFGAYTGGLSVRDPAIADLFGPARYHVLSERRVLPIAPERIV